MVCILRQLREDHFSIKIVVLHPLQTLNPHCKRPGLRFFQQVHPEVATNADTFFTWRFTVLCLLFARQGDEGFQAIDSF